MPMPRKSKRNAMIVACYKQGLSLREVAEQLELKFQTVYVILKRDAPEILRSDKWNGRKTQAAA